MRRRRWATFGLVAGSIVGTVLVVDLVLLLVLGPVRVVEDFYQADPRLGYRMKPDIEFVFASPYHGYHATVRTNDLGLRDDPIVLPKPPGTYRILLLGDSMTASLEVDKHQTFEARLERDLAEALPPGRQVDVINTGVRGYNLDNILAFFEAEGSTLQADLVVYVFVDNDLTDAATPQPQVTDGSRGFRVPGLLGRLANHSHLAHRLVILQQVILLRLRRGDESDTPGEQVSVSRGLYTMFSTRDHTGPIFQRTAARIARLAGLAGAHGASFLLVGGPQREEIDPETQDWWRRYLERPEQPFDFDGVRAFLAWVGESQHIATLDPVPAFRRALHGDNAYWFHKDNHLNAAGQRLLAQELAGWVRQDGRFRQWAAAGNQQ